MTNTKFKELLTQACNGDDDELFRICHEHEKYRVMLATAYQVLAKFPDGHAAYRGLLLLALERSNSETRPIIQEILNEIELGFPEIL